MSNSIFKPTPVSGLWQAHLELCTASSLCAQHGEPALALESVHVLASALESCTARGDGIAQGANSLAGVVTCRACFVEANSWQHPVSKLSA